MFTLIWRKYLPVIFVLIKKSTQGEQVVGLNQTDFDRASGRRKMKFSFTNLQLNKGKVNNDAKHAAIAKDLAELLQQDALTGKYIRTQCYEFSLSNDFQLTIKNNSVLEDSEILEEEIAEVENS